MRSLILACFLLLTQLLLAQSKLSPKDYMAYIERTKTERTDSVSFEMMDLKLIQSPIEYFVAASLVEGSITSKEAKKLLKEKSEVTFFGMLVQTKEGGLLDQGSWSRSEQMKYYAVNFKNTLMAVTTKGDTLSCQNFIFQAGASFGNYAYFEFEIPKKGQEIKEIIFLAEPIRNTFFNCILSAKNEKNKKRLKIKN